MPTNLKSKSKTMTVKERYEEFIRGAAHVTLPELMTLLRLPGDTLADLESELFADFQPGEIDSAYIYPGNYYLLGNHNPPLWVAHIDNAIYKSKKFVDLEPMLFEHSREDGYDIPMEFLHKYAVREIHKWEDWQEDGDNSPCLLYFPNKNNFHGLEAFQYWEDRHVAIGGLNERTEYVLLDKPSDLRNVVMRDHVRPGNKPTRQLIWVSSCTDVFKGYGLTATGYTREEAEDALWFEYMRKAPSRNEKFPNIERLREYYGIHTRAYEIGKGYMGDDDFNVKDNEIKSIGRSYV